jgi:hypothetical protein
VHRSLGQQHQDGGADVATAAAPTVSATSSCPTARAWAEAEAARAETPAEAGSETGTETRAEWPVVAGVLTADKVAKLATGLPALLVQCTPCMGMEALETEARCSGTPREFPFYMGKWVVHMFISFLERQRRMRYRYNYDISQTIVMQRRICGGPSDMGFVARSSGVAQQR